MITDDPVSSKQLYDLMLVSGMPFTLGAARESRSIFALSRSQDVGEADALAIFDSWTQEQREQAATYFCSVVGGAMAGEFGDAYPAIPSPDHLKPYGCYDLAEQERQN